MARKYGITGNCLNTASATLPLANIVGTAAVRTALYDIMLGSAAAPADNPAAYKIQRSTTVGTWAGSGGAAITPQPLDPNDPAAVTTANQGVCSAGPTLTSAAFPLGWAQNQRATFRWVAAPGSEIKIPATANNGLCLMTLTLGSLAVDTSFCFLVEE
jgi:hypothetical protein